MKVLKLVLQPYKDHKVGCGCIARDVIVSAPSDMIKHTLLLNPRVYPCIIFWTDSCNIAY